MGALKEKIQNCRLGRAIAKPNKAAIILGFVPQPNLRKIRFLALTQAYYTMGALKAKIQ